MQLIVSVRPRPSEELVGIEVVRNGGSTLVHGVYPEIARVLNHRTSLKFHVEFFFFNVGLHFIAMIR